MLHTFFRTFDSRKDFEECYYVDAPQGLSLEQSAKVCWVLMSPGATVTLASQISEHSDVLEIGPRLNIETAFSTGAVRICANIGVSVRRIEMSRRFVAPRKTHTNILAKECDHMTQTFYPRPLVGFDSGVSPEPVREIDIIGRGADALRDANVELGLGMDERDIRYYTAMFQRLGRNPTDVECFQIGNGNSEHSRHWFFRGEIVIDGAEMPHTLMDIVKEPWKRNPGISLVAFHDNAGVYRGYEVPLLVPVNPGLPSAYHITRVLVHLAITAETHNHPTMWEPFQGAATGGDGRRRDNFAVGRGAYVSFGGAGYCAGNLHIPGHTIPGEETGRGQIFDTFASPLDILVRGSDGISDYGNKIGEPLIGGFCRTFGQTIGGKRVEYIKPVLYAAGTSFLPDASLPKGVPEIGMLIVRIGGPAYRVGVGGGSASSIEGGTGNIELDFKSVQRCDPEMQNRADRVIRACVEMFDKNPIVSIHDQGAGGPSNVITELMEPKGGKVEIRNIVAGDKTMSVLELWVAEYQEGYGLLVHEEHIALFQAMCAREEVNCEVLGVITGDGNVVVTDGQDGSTPVELSLMDVLGELPQKKFEMQRMPQRLLPLVIPYHLTCAQLVAMVFKQTSVGSKKHLTDKVDRSVTGLVARQQHCGPKLLPVADCGVMALSHFDTRGTASAYGEHPLAMLIDPQRGARLAVAEALLNLAGTKISSRKDIECRANWMWAAKQPGQGARMYDAARAMSDFMLALGIRADGGKDSLSMSAKVGPETVLSPGTLVIKAAAPVPDITKVCTPDLKEVGTYIGHLDLGDGRSLGGSALAQALGQLGDECADVKAEVLAAGFDAMQRLVADDLVLSCHDVSDGGLFTTISEMCMAGNIGAHIHLSPHSDWYMRFFGQSPGMVFEYRASSQTQVERIIREAGLADRFRTRGTTVSRKMLTIAELGDTPIFSDTLTNLRELWESTSTQLKLLQLDEPQVRSEVQTFAHETVPEYRLSFAPRSPMPLTRTVRPRIAVIREEGSNGDAEMRAAFMLAGFAPDDISMHDIRSGAITTLAPYRGAVFVGGFSFADIFGSATGWAAGIRFDAHVRRVFDDFYARGDTFSLGICNGCQLMIRLGLVPYPELGEMERTWMEHNRSRKFESRYVAARIEESPALMLAGMTGSVLGVHSAHGEGRFSFPDAALLRRVRDEKLIAVSYVGIDGEATEQYPYNPNGSPHGIAALCSPDGRHLAMMPHPERTVLAWQQAYAPADWRGHASAPWLRMFQNAFEWCA